MWDIHKVPANGDELISFIRLIRSEYRPKQDGIILVHCSGGVGRNGTFIALDRLLQQFDKLPCNGYLDIYGTVLDIRRCRNKMVQNEVSFHLIESFPINILSNIRINIYLSINV
jgi:protein tyrosine phosphatase